MEKKDRKAHWEKIYSTKQLNEVSWYQPTPDTSISFLKDSNLPKDAAIIDVGGGDSFFVDYLVEEGYSNVTVLDISERAIERAKFRLGVDASKVTWLTSDVNDFLPSTIYDFWHDRAAFHFLTNPTEIKQYKETVESAVKPNGHVVIGTFSKTGPLKCSGIEITQYSHSDLIQLFDSFQIVTDLEVKHGTPFDTTQDFIFCHFLNK